MGRFSRLYTVPTPYAIATVIPVALGTIRKIFVDDLGWELEFDNSDTSVQAHTNAPFMNGARLYTTVAATIILAQVVVKSPCGRWRLMWYWSTTNASNGLACIRVRVNDPTTVAAAQSAIFTNGSSQSELVAGISTILEIDTFGQTFNMVKKHKTAAGVITNTARLLYQHSFLKNVEDIPDVSGINVVSASTTTVPQIAAYTPSQEGMANEESTPAINFITPLSTTPNYNLMPYEFIAVQPVSSDAPLYGLRGWVYAYINKPEAATENVIAINGRTYVCYELSATVRTYFEIDDYIPADLQ